MSDLDADLRAIIDTQKSILEEIGNLRYGDSLDASVGEKIATKVVTFIGSWKFIITQSLILTLWVSANALMAYYRWDPYPFILLNLVLSFQAAFASPLILMAQNLTDRRDRRRTVDAYRSIASIKTMMEDMQSKLRIVEEENGGDDV